jgi:hypothetical protein
MAEEYPDWNGQLRKLLSGSYWHLTNKPASMLTRNARVGS